ncbi:hypothetical protein K1719_037342 [Acacia pycnantha]|nr:hypothetical protein K1719_037342 [Acacia pycnantha]
MTNSGSLSELVFLSCHLSRHLARLGRFIALSLCLFRLGRLVYRLFGLRTDSGDCFLRWSWPPTFLLETILKPFLQGPKPKIPNTKTFCRKKKSGGSSTGREGKADFLRQLRRKPRQRAKKYAESFFYRLRNPNGNYPDNFSEDELQQIGLGYDRFVRFMDKDDPNLRHPYDWYKYGQFGPYSWRGVVLGDPVRGRFTDERVTIINEVKDHEEWEKIEQFEMASEFGKRVKQMDKSNGFRYFWVFVRHPRWRISELPWQQWTLVSEVVLEAGKQRLDKWSLMGRLGNKARSLITQCAAWMRPDIIYVKRPVYQCRFEPQDNFFNALIPFLDPSTENDYLLELENDDGTVELCTYYGGLCKIVKVSQKHSLMMWSMRIEIEHYENDDDDGDDDDEEDYGDGGDDDQDLAMDMEDIGNNEEDTFTEEDGDEISWNEKLRKALGSGEAMEKLAKESLEFTSKLYMEHSMTGRGEENEAIIDGDETALRGKWAKVSPDEWKYAGIGPWKKKVKKSKLPPELFLRAAVRPFTYRNLVKEIVLTRHAILDGDIGRKV